MLKKPDPDASDAYAPPKLAPGSASVPAAPRVSAAVSSFGDEPESKTSSTLETAAPMSEGTRDMREPEVGTSPSFYERSLASEPEEDVFTGALPTTTPGGGSSARVPANTGSALTAPVRAVSPSAAAGADSAARAERPRDVWFRSSQDEVTMSAISGSPLDDPNETFSDKGTRSPSDGVFTTAAAPRARIDREDGTEEDLGHTNENAAFDEELESTAARPQRLSEVSTASALDVTGANSAADEDEEVVVADELADLIEDEEHEGEPEAEMSEADSTDQGDKPKRKASSLPPPLPRT
jgi:hypothetical protein